MPIVRSLSSWAWPSNLQRTIYSKNCRLRRLFLKKRLARTRSSSWGTIVASCGSFSAAQSGFSVASKCTAVSLIRLPRPATRFARYLRPDELHTVFNFPYLCCPWDAASLREVIDGTLAFHAAAGAPATWVLSNHDVDRHVSRYGRADTSFALDRRDHSQPVDLALGTRRARAAALLTMALPGSVYLYQ